MATLDWPSLPAFAPRGQDGFTIGVAAPKARWAALYTGDSSTNSHLADRLRITLQLPPCAPAAANLREAFILGLVSTGDWVRLGHLLKWEPMGTLRGSPTVAAVAAAGARSFTLQGPANATLLGGDMLGVGNQLLPVAYQGAVANGLGVMVVPLSVPLRRPLGAGQAVVWQQPLGTFELLSSQVDMGYGRGRWQRPLTLPFKEVFAA